MRSVFIAQLYMKIKSHFEDVDQLIAKVKAVTIRNKTRQAKFSAIAALYYAENLPEVKAIVESFVGSGILVTQAKLSLQKKWLSWSSAQNQRPI